MATTRVSTLLHWCSNMDIFIDPRIQVLDDPILGIQVRSLAKQEIPIDQLLVRIPKVSALSVKNCSFAQEISDLNLSCVGLDAQLGLSLALSLELALGEHSTWWGYLQSLPLSVDLPMFWPLEADDADTSQALSFLERTQAGSKLLASNLLASLETFYANVSCVKLVSHNLARMPTSEEFRTAFGLVSSRAFIADAYIGLCMVPIADAFNHSQPNHVQLESEHNVCPLCGALSLCPHDSEEEFSDSSVEDEEEHPTVDDMEMSTLLPVFPDDEVFNTYGATLPNVELVLQYGFILDGNDNDLVLFDVTDVYEAIRGSRILSLEEHARLLGAQDEVQKQRASSGDQSELLFDYSSERNRSMLGINADGKVSVALWTIVAAIVGEDSESTTPLPTLLQYQMDLESILQEPGQQDDHFYLRGTVKGSLKGISCAIQRLCSTRVRHVFPDGCYTCTDVFGLLDDMPPQYTRARLALRLLLTEGTILESCNDTWKEVENFISAVN